MKLGKRSKKFVIVLACVIAVFVLLPLLAELLGLAVGLSVLLLEIAGCFIFLVCIPLFFWIMGEAGYKVFLRPFVRARHIRKIRSRRLLLEAAARDNHPVQ